MLYLVGKKIVIWDVMVEAGIWCCGSRVRLWGLVEFGRGFQITTMEQWSSLEGFHLARGWTSLPYRYTYALPVLRVYMWDQSKEHGSHVVPVEFISPPHWKLDFPNKSGGGDAITGSVFDFERCLELRRWLSLHAGELPRRRCEEAVEKSLGNWLCTVLARRYRAVGSKPSQRMLTSRQRVYLEQILEAGSELLHSQSMVLPICTGGRNVKRALEEPECGRSRKRIEATVIIKVE